MKVLVTGANGFLGGGLVKTLSKTPNIVVLPHTKSDDLNSLYSKLSEAEFIFHLAGVIRSDNRNDFLISNIQLTARITEFLAKNKIQSPIYYSSSTHCGVKSEYGTTKLAAEVLLSVLHKQNGNHIINHRLTRIFGPNAKPFYNSIVATFCYSIVNNLPFHISDDLLEIEICYIDDWIKVMINLVNNIDVNTSIISHKITLGDLVGLLNNFKNGREVENTKINFSLRHKLYLTYKFYENLI